MPQQFGAGLGERDPPSGAGQQRGAQLTFEPSDQLAEGGLTDEQLLRRSSEVQFGGHRRECLQLAQLHRLKIPAWPADPGARDGLIAPRDQLVR